MTKKQSNLILILTIAGVVVGGLLGYGLNSGDPSDTVMKLVGFPGQLFVRALKMMIIPLVVASIIVGVASLGSLKETGKIGLRTVIYYFVTTVIAVIIGIALVSTIQPGVGQEALDNIPYDQLDQGLRDRLEKAGAGGDLSKHTSGLDRVLGVFTKMIPDNIVGASVELNVLGLIVFSILFGLAISAVGKSAEPVLNFFQGVNDIVMKIVMWFMWVVPIGIASLIAHKLGASKSFWEDLEKLSYYAGTVLAGLTIHFFLVLPGVYWFITRRNPFTFIKGVLPALFTALGTSSSAATLPVTMECVTENNNVDRKVADFVLPVGATINMDGTAIYEAISVIWIAQMLGIDLGLSGMLIVALIASLAAVGAAAIPSAGLITMVMVLTAVGIGSEGYSYIGYIFAIDWFLDRCRTAVNVGGDAYGAGVIDHLETRDDERLAAASA